MERIFSHPKVTDDSDVIKLSPVQQLQAVIATFSNKEVAELEAQQIKIKDTNKKFGLLVKSIEEAIRPLYLGKHRVVLMEIPLNVVELLERYLANKASVLQYYDVEVIMPREKNISKLHLLVKKKEV